MCIKLQTVGYIIDSIFRQALILLYYKYRFFFIGNMLLLVGSRRTINSAYQPTVKKLNPDLNAHVTEKALVALFNKVEEEENSIRTNPAQCVTDLMKKVFSYADNYKK